MEFGSSLPLFLTPASNSNPGFLNAGNAEMRSLSPG